MEVVKERVKDFYKRGNVGLSVCTDFKSGFLYMTWKIIWREVAKNITRSSLKIGKRGRIVNRMGNGNRRRTNHRVWIT